jgi:hypothetical protein
MLGGAPLALFIALPLRWLVAALIDYKPAKRRLLVAESEKQRLENKINDLEFANACLKARLATGYRPAEISGCSNPVRAMRRSTRDADASSADGLAAVGGVAALTPKHPNRCYRFYAIAPIGLRV